MPRVNKPADLFKGIKRGSTERPRRPEPEPQVIAERSDKVTFSLTVKRHIFEAYKKEGKGNYGPPMRRQLERKFE
jgi:hypothetical protein